MKITHEAVAKWLAQKKGINIKKETVSNYRNGRYGSKFGPAIDEAVAALTAEAARHFTAEAQRLGAQNL